MVAVEGLGIDALVAELHADLVRAEDLTEACSIVLDAVRRGQENRAAALLARSEAGVRGAIAGLEPDDARDVIGRLTEADSHLVSLLHEGLSPTVFPQGSFPPLEFQSYAVFSFAGLHPGPPLGIVLIEARDFDDGCRQMVDIMGRIGPALARVGQLEALSSRSTRFARQRDLLTTIINSLPDPVLLTNHSNDMVLANRRAEQLFTAT
jgi:PAS domain-containing protein